MTAPIKLRRFRIGEAHAIPGVTYEGVTGYTVQYAATGPGARVDSVFIHGNIVGLQLYEERKP